MSKNYINVTPHEVALNDGRVFPPSGIVARVGQYFTNTSDPDIVNSWWGEVVFLPEPVEGTIYIVSGIVHSAIKGLRDDCVCPATGHKDVVRNDKGQIVSVPFFIK
jgi:hypothetical protein